MVDKGLLHGREGLEFALLIVLGLPFYCDDRFFIKVVGGKYAGTAFCHRPITADLDHGAGMAYALPAAKAGAGQIRSEEHTSELQSRGHLVCRLLLEKKKK